MNPTKAVLEERVAALEGGTAALAVASGHAAQVSSSHLMQPGDEFVAARQLYGGSINQFNHSFKNLAGMSSGPMPTISRTFERAITPKTKAIFVESIANPGGLITDIEAIAKIARKAGVPLIVDNTLATPYLIKPFEHGADIVIHSVTKFIGGHGNSMAGVIVDGGNFDWSKRQAIRCCANRGRNITASSCTRPSATSPSRSPPRIGLARSRTCALAVQRLPRSHRHRDAAPAHAAALRQRAEGRRMALRHPAVAWVNYAGLGDKYYALAQKYAPRARARCSPSASRAATTRA